MNCGHCGSPLPEPSRRDRVYCGNNCRALASYYRRQAGLTPPLRWSHPALEADDPVLRAAAHQARRLGEEHGWSRSTARCVIDGLVILLAGQPPGQRVPLTEVHSRTSRHTSNPRIAEVLAELDLLDNDVVPPIFGKDVRACLLALLDGDERTRPRHPESVRAYFG